MKISAVSFVFEEEPDMKECLENISGHVDEIVLVDMTSEDKTAEIAYRYTKQIYRMPHLICGDQYKMFLAAQACGDWLLWFYPDERFNLKFLEEMHKLTDSDKFDAYALMRHEYMNGERNPYHGILSSPNYQNRLHRKGHGIFYTELVHAELHGRYRACYLPEDYWMEHRKTYDGQEFDNYRTYVEMKHLLWKYRDTKVEPYKTFCDSYRKIIADSETLNASGQRNVHPAEEEWWRWWEWKSATRLPMEKWMEIKGVRISEATHG